jgi:hypothetical protein
LRGARRLGSPLRSPGAINGRRCWQAHVPDVAAGKWWFTQIFVNGRRRLRARLPKQGFYRFTGVSDDEAKKELLINNVVGTTFQAVRKISNLKAVSDSKVTALQKFINVEIPEERLRALAGSMGNQLTRNVEIER